MSKLSNREQVAREIKECILAEGKTLPIDELLELTSIYEVLVSKKTRRGAAQHDKAAAYLKRFTPQQRDLLLCMAEHGGPTERHIRASLGLGLDQKPSDAGMTLSDGTSPANPGA